MFVLVACEESQTVCLEFRKAGHIAFSCDLQPCSGGFPEYHIKGDVLPLLNGNCSFYTCDGKYHYIGKRWDLIIAHPPCTYLSNAGVRWMYDKPGVINSERFDKMMSARSFFLAIFNADCDKICIENPVPMNICMLPPYQQKIHPYMFGEPYSKGTCLWLKGLPGLFPSLHCCSYVPWCGCDNSPARSPKLRSKTFPGVARAMVQMWG